MIVDNHSRKCDSQLIQSNPSYRQPITLFRPRYEANTVDYRTACHGPQMLEATATGYRRAASYHLDEANLLAWTLQRIYRTQCQFAAPKKRRQPQRCFMAVLGSTHGGGGVRAWPTEVSDCFPHSKPAIGPHKEQELPTWECEKHSLASVDHAVQEIWHQGRLSRFTSGMPHKGKPCLTCVRGTQSLKSSCPA